MTHLTDKYFAVEVPGDAVDIGIYNYGLNDAIEYMHDIEGVAAYDVDNLPPGTYRFLFTTKAATEEQAASVVQIISNGRISGRPQYRRYDRDNELPARMWTRDARHSLETLLRSKGLDPENNYALIEKL